MYLVLCHCCMGGSPPPYIASPGVDPWLYLRGGIMHVRDGCRGAVGDCWRKLGLIGPNKGSADPLLRPFRLIFGRCIPCGLLVEDRRVHSWRYVGLACHWSLRIHVRTIVFVGSVFSLRLGLICFRMWAL